MTGQAGVEGGGEEEEEEEEEEECGEIERVTYMPQLDGRDPSVAVLVKLAEGLSETLILVVVIVMEMTRHHAAELVKLDLPAVWRHTRVCTPTYYAKHYNSGVCYLSLV